MAKDPAFLFYPGDYLRDTQCLSENSQVAYDRIMCEHMRNICISQQQLNFFTKKLSEDEKDELLMVLDKSPDGYQISWVAESINKRRAYSESRRKNRASKKSKKGNNICKTYDEHMENENEIVIENINEVIIESENSENPNLDIFDVEVETEAPPIHGGCEHLEESAKKFLAENTNYIWETYDSRNLKPIYDKIVILLERNKLPVNDDSIFNSFVHLWQLAQDDNFHSKHLTLSYLGKHFNKIIQSKGKKKKESLEDKYHKINSWT